MECKVHGAVSQAKVQDLCEVLKGLSGRPAATFKHHEVVIKGTRPTGPPIEMKLQRSLLEDANDPMATKKWRVRHESLPMRGNAAEQLQATVRGVTEACCYGANALNFWLALGFKVEYNSVQEGALFVVWQGQHQLFIRITCIKKVQGGNLATAAPLTPDFWLVEVYQLVMTDTPAQMEGLYGEACKAIAEFADKIKQYVELKKPGAR